MAAARTLILGNSDGIGLALTRLLLSQGHDVVGISRREAPIENESYRHHVADVTSESFPRLLQTLMAADGAWERIVFCVGIGNLEEETWWRGEAKVIETNFLAAVRTLELIVPVWLEDGTRGHFVALSSLTDVLHVEEAASYCSSKAGLSRYLESVGLRLRKNGIHVSNVRFGFVDTKMARSAMRPFMLTPEKAARYLKQVLEKKPLRASYPLRAWALVNILQLIMRPLILLK